MIKRSNATLIWDNFEEEPEDRVVKVYVKISQWIRHEKESVTLKSNAIRG